MSIDFEALNKLDIERLNNTLVEACATGNLDLVEALLTSPKLKFNPDISVNNEHPLRWACINNQVTIIKYLLSSPKLKKHAHVHAMLGTPFREALKHNSEELLQFYIFDLQIERNPLIEQALIEYKSESIFQKAEIMFQARDLNKALANNHKNKKIKTKL